MYASLFANSGLFNMVCLEPAFLLKLFWLRNYPDESITKLCALTGIFKVGLESVCSKPAVLKTISFGEYLWNQRFGLVLLIFILFIYRISTSHVCMYYCIRNNFTFFTVYAKNIQQNISRDSLIKVWKSSNLVMRMEDIIFQNSI